MTDERYDYYQSQQQKARIAHRAPSTTPKMNSESENHAKDGPCQVIVLPNLPSVGGRVKYAMGAMTANQFSQRCGISATYLNQLCTGKAKTLSAYNANRIAGASSMGVTIGWLLGLKSADEKEEIKKTPGFLIANFVQQILSEDELDRTKYILGYSWDAMRQWLDGENLPKKNEVIAIAKQLDKCTRNREPSAVEYLKMAGISEDELPNLDNFTDRLEFAKNRCGKTARINDEIGASHGYYSAVVRERLNVGDKFKAPLAKALDVEYEWLFKGCPNDKELAKRKGINAGIAVKDKDFVGSKAINRGSEHKKMEEKEEKIVSGTHLRFEGVYSGDVLSALVSVLKGTYRVNLTIDEVETTT